MSKAKLTVCLLSLLALAFASVPVEAAAGCCQHRSSCERTDDKQACTDAGGIHYQLGFCADNKCQPSAGSEPIEGPIHVQPVQIELSAFAEPLFCPVATQGR